MRVRLLQARAPGDVVRAEERAAFAARLDLPIDDVLCHDLLADPPDADAVTGDIDAVLVGGSGAFSVYDDHAWVRGFLRLLGELVDRQTPMFASCFGFQGLVVALGGVVEKDELNAEVGTFPVRLAPAAADDPLFGALPPTFEVQLGHKDRATRFPAALTHLAASDRCPHQALRVPGAPIWATQFHPELTRDDNLLRFARYEASYTATFGAARYAEMVAGFRPSPVNDTLLRAWRATLEA